MGFAEVFVVAAAESVLGMAMRRALSAPHGEAITQAVLTLLRLGWPLRQSALSTATSSKGLFVQLVTAVPEWYRGG